MGKRNYKHWGSAASYRAGVADVRWQMSADESSPANTRADTSGGIHRKAPTLPECQLAFMIEGDPPSGNIDVGA